jgi:hypothetical protein
MALHSCILSITQRDDKPKGSNVQEIDFPYLKSVVQIWKFLRPAEGGFWCPWISKGWKSLHKNHTNATSAWVENNGFAIEEERKTPKKEDAQFICRDSERKPLKRKRKASLVGPSCSIMVRWTHHTMGLVFGNHKGRHADTKRHCGFPVF